MSFSAPTRRQPTCTYGAVQHGMFHPYLVRFWNYVDAGILSLQLGPLLQAEPLRVGHHLALRPAHHLARPVVAHPHDHHRHPARHLPGLASATRSFDYTATGVGLRPLRDAALPSGHADAGRLQLPLAAPAGSPPSGVRRGPCSPTPTGFILPVAALTMLSVAGLSRFMRGTVLEVLVQDYVRTAKAKGCSRVADAVSTRLSQRSRADRHASSASPSPRFSVAPSIIESVFNYERPRHPDRQSPRRISTSPPCWALPCSCRSLTLARQPPG